MAPERYKKFGALIGSTAPIGGLALGALVTGFAIQFTRSPNAIIFGFLTAVFLLGTIVIIGSAETAIPRTGVIRAFIPRFAVPRAARREFVAGIPVLVGTWMLGGLFFGLIPSIIRGVFHINSGLINGTLVALLPTASVIASLVLSRVGARPTTLIGEAATLVGIATVVIGIAVGWFPFLVIGAIIGGVGFGAAFSGTLRIIAPLANSYQRAELFAAVYLVSYLAYGAPALVAGELIGVIGLLHTVIGYGVVDIAAASVGLLTQLRLARLR